MDLSGLKDKRRKRIEIKHFGGDDYITVKYIDRDIYNYINKLTVKTEDGLVYSKMQEIPGKIDSSEKYKLAMMKLSADELQKGRECSQIVNKMLIDHGLDKDDHSFTDSDKPVKLDYNVLNQIGGQSDGEIDLFTFILNKIRSFNNEFNLGELKGKR